MGLLRESPPPPATVPRDLYELALERINAVENRLDQLRAGSVSREFHDAIVARCERDWRELQERLATVVQHDNVPRALYDAAVTDRRRWERRYAKVVRSMTDMKRHELGMIPRDFDAAAANAVNTLGPKTQLAIEDFAAGDPELRRLLIGKAVLLWAEARSDISDLEAVDEYVSGLITQGDTG